MQEELEITKKEIVQHMGALATVVDIYDIQQRTAGFKFQNRVFGARLAGVAAVIGTIPEIKEEVNELGDNVTQRSDELCNVLATIPDIDRLDSAGILKEEKFTETSKSDNEELLLSHTTFESKLNTANELIIKAVSDPAASLLQKPDFDETIGAAKGNVMDAVSKLMSSATL
ncbi:hypothetical protein VTL71DRAFT_11 [Oculimacula yallundae]|uniref:Uncharacterized protein n=1 Tax=Oculimacula yallundae TaxID=86028 RepID=A0ABR4CYV2_9HELO